MVFEELYLSRKADGHFISCCPQPTAFGALCVQQGQAEKYIILRNTSLLCRPVPYCAATEVLGDGSGLAV